MSVLLCALCIAAGYVLAHARNFPGYSRAMRELRAELAGCLKREMEAHERTREATERDDGGPDERGL